MRICVTLFVACTLVVLSQSSSLSVAAAAKDVVPDASSTVVTSTADDAQFKRRLFWGCRKDSCCPNCPGTGEPMVYNSYFRECVCATCKDATYTQVVLCRRRCLYGDSNCAQCFPDDATVSLRDAEGHVKKISMKQLSVGDYVLTEKGFSKVFAFMDHVRGVETEYVRLQTASGAKISITADHIVYAHEQREPVHAGTVREGDMLWIEPGYMFNSNNTKLDFVSSRVVKVTYGKEKGMHAPLTEQGSVVVNNVLASSYAKVQTLTWGERTIVTGHALNKYLHTPLYIACTVRPSLCGEAWHAADSGRHAWTQFILDHFSWLQFMNLQHNDMYVALVDHPSVGSCVAAFAQLAIAGILSLVFGPSSFGVAFAVVLVPLFFILKNRSPLLKVKEI